MRSILRIDRPTEGDNGEYQCKYRLRPVTGRGLKGPRHWASTSVRPPQQVTKGKNLSLQLLHVNGFKAMDTKYESGQIISFILPLSLTASESLSLDQLFIQHNLSSDRRKRRKIASGKIVISRSFPPRAVRRKCWFWSNWPRNFNFLIKYIVFSAMDYAKILGGASCPIDSYCLNGGTCVFYAAIGELSCRYVKATFSFFSQSLRTWWGPFISF